VQQDARGDMQVSVSQGGRWDPASVGGSAFREPLQLDRWQRWTLHMRWTNAASQGFLEVYEDGRLVDRRTNWASLGGGAGAYPLIGTYNADSYGPGHVAFFYCYSISDTTPLGPQPPPALPTTRPPAKLRATHVRRGPRGGCQKRSPVERGRRPPAAGAVGRPAPGAPGSSRPRSRRGHVADSARCRPLRHRHMSAGHALRREALAVGRSTGHSHETAGRERRARVGARRDARHQRSGLNASRSSDEKSSGSSQAAK
jgi:hypothetical protein